MTNAKIMKKIAHAMKYTRTSLAMTNTHRPNRQTSKVMRATLMFWVTLRLR